MKNLIRTTGDISKELILKDLARKLHKDMCELLILRGSSISNLIMGGVLTGASEYNFRQLRQLPGSQSVMEVCSHLSAYLQFTFTRVDQVITVLIDPHASWSEQVASRIFRTLPQLQQDTFAGGLESSAARRFRKYGQAHKHSRQSLVRLETIVSFAAALGFKTEIRLKAKCVAEDGYTSIHVSCSVPPSRRLTLVDLLATHSIGEVRQRFGNPGAKSNANASDEDDRNDADRGDDRNGDDDDLNDNYDDDDDLDDDFGSNDDDLSDENDGDGDGDENRERDRDDDRDRDRDDDRERDRDGDRNRERD